MKLINNRFKIKEIIVTDEYEEGYIVLDLWNNDKKSLLKLYDLEKDSNVIKFYTDNFIEISQIQHKNLLKCDSFHLVESINLKKTNMLLYYTIAEYMERPIFRACDLDFNLDETLKITLDLMSVIDFLHFRGYVYQYLNPTTTIFSSDRSVKIVDLSTISEYKISSYYEDSIEKFIAPEIFIDHDIANIKSDFYSLGMMMRYLFLNDYTNDLGEYNYKSNLLLNEEQMDFLTLTMDNLTNSVPELRDVSLRTHIDNIINKFKLGYTYNLVEERSYLFTRTKTIGREKEIQRILSMDLKRSKVAKGYDLALISGNEGDGKTKLLNELSYKLKIRGRDVYYIDVKENDNIELADIKNLLKQTIKNAPNHILSKYSEDFSTLLYETSDQTIEKEINSEVDKFKNLNRISNYLKEISSIKPMYIIIDNFQKIRDGFLILLDYLINNMNNCQLSIIVGYEGKVLTESNNISETLKRWTSNYSAINIKLEDLNEDEIGELTKSILGISYIPKRFSTILYKGSQGNPMYLEYIIKYLYNKNELYINERGNWGLKTEDYSTLPIPSNINNTIGAQLSKIKGDNLLVLKAVSIFHSSFTKQLLMKMIDIDINDFDKSLKILIDEKLIEKYDDFSFTIVNNGWKRIMYSGLALQEKESLHQSAAKVIIEEYGKNTNLVLEELIYHLVKSNDKEKALKVIFKELNKLENKYSDQYLYLCEQAYELVKDTSDINKLIVLDNLLDIHVIKGNIKRTDNYLNILFIEAENQNNIEYKLKAMYYKASNYLKENNIDEFYMLIKQLEDLSRIHNYYEGIIGVIILKCRMAMDNMDLSYIEILLNEAIDLSTLHNANRYLGTIYNLLGLANSIEGNIDIAIYNYKLSIEHSINTNNMIEATKPMNNLGEIYSLNHGNLDMALYYYKSGLEIANKYGFTQVSIVFQNNLGELYKNTVDMHKALDFFEESKKGAIKINDYKMIFLANVNLGSIYISYDMFDKAYECFKFLEREYENNPIIEAEIITQYNMFLGEYYEYFGQFDLSIGYFTKVTESFKDFNTRDYLRAKVKLVYNNLFQSIPLKKMEVITLINELVEAKLFYDMKKFVLFVSIFLHFRNEKEFGNELLIIYDNSNTDIEDATLLDLRKCLDLLVNNTAENLDEIEKIVEQSNNLKQSNILLYVNIALGNLYFSNANFIKSTKCFFKALDLIFISGKNIPSLCLYDKYIAARNGDMIKDCIQIGLKSILNENTNFKLDNSNELNNIINYLPDDVFNKIFHNAIDLKYMESIGDLISNLSDDFDKNIDLILEYIKLITLAERGHVLQFDDDTNNYISISSLVADDSCIPSENMLIQANKSNYGLLINKNLDNMDKSKYFQYLQCKSVGIVCVPISIPQKSKEVIKDRRKRVYTANQNNKGYIYIETQGSLNRFDLERLKVIKSLSYLMYLNIENKTLKLIANVDKLTGTLTRKYFEQRFVEIQKSLDESDQSYTVLMLDIDNFKDINDSYGHLKGDEVLSLLGNTIKETIRSTDLVGRYGGEEFILLLRNSTIELGKKIAEKVCLNIERMQVPGINRPITVSIGLSQYPNHSQFKEELIAKADHALYYAKNFLGKNNSAIWNVEMGYSFNRTDKLAGVLTGNTSIDNRNLLVTLDMIDLGISSMSFKDKVFLLLGRTLDTIDGEYATLLLIDDNGHPKPYGSRKRLNSQWINTPILNMDKINEVIKNKQKLYLIDWDNTQNISPLTGVPNWQSIMVIPLIKQDILKGIMYISVPLDEIEFDFDSSNLTKLLCNIFSSNL